ncbi:MAG: hypothetical protein GY737_21595 [Desulfobacteraceae bacterium]|nr:hypothetical protein [Desulfobacteraceae bacterium]
METERVELAAPEIEIALSSAPSMGKVFSKALLLSLSKRQGVLKEKETRGIRVFMDRIPPDPGRIEAFRRVCREPMDRTVLPVVYLETLFVGMLGRLITSPFFPISPMGLIHTRQRIVQHRPVDEKEILDAQCGLRRMTKSGKGVTLECFLEVRSDNELVWEGVATFLSRNRATGKKKKKRHTPPPLPVREIFDLAEDTGRAYARASNDYNPHHLYGFSARLLGFRSPIAHGMYTLARSVAAIQGKNALDSPMLIETGFKLPVYLPARAALGYDTFGDTISFELKDADSGLPHVAGSITSL